MADSLSMYFYILLALQTKILFRCLCFVNHATY